MKSESAQRRPTKSGVTLFGIVLMLSIGGALALSLLWVIPNIRQEGLNQQRLVDVASIKSAVITYTKNNDSIPKSWSDVQDQINLDYYSLDEVFESLKSNETIEKGLDLGRTAAQEAKDYIGVFARSQCDQAWVADSANDSILKDGNDNQLAILYVLDGVGLVCEQINHSANNEAKT